MLSWLALIVALLLPQARASEAPATPAPVVEVLVSPSGDLRFEKNGRRVHADQFARYVGDTATLRSYNLAHKRVLVGSWALWGMGGILAGSGLAMITMTPLAQQPEIIALAGVGIGLTGGLSIITGFVTFTQGKKRLHDPNTWYTPAAAQRWLGEKAALQFRPVVTGNGLALAARW